jgi:hypothetical protein
MQLKPAQEPGDCVIELAGPFHVRHVAGPAIRTSSDPAIALCISTLNCGGVNVSSSPTMIR